MSNPADETNHGIEFNGVMAGWIHSAEGGHATSDAATGRTKLDDVRITCGTGMKKAFYDFIQDFFEGKHPRRDGAIVGANAKHEATSRLMFSGALITEFGMPALDAASKDAAKMTLRLAPKATH